MEIGRVVSIENNHKPVEVAKKGTEVCIKVDPIPGDAPKMLGRHFDENDLLVSKVIVLSFCIFGQDQRYTDYYPMLYQCSATEGFTFVQFRSLS